MADTIACLDEDFEVTSTVVGFEGVKPCFHSDHELGILDAQTL